MRLFQGFQLAHERIVFGVADFRLIENVILIFVMFQLFAQFLGAFDRRLFMQPVG